MLMVTDIKHYVQLSKDDKKQILSFGWAKAALVGEWFVRGRIAAAGSAGCNLPRDRSGGPVGPVRARTSERPPVPWTGQTG